MSLIAADKATVGEKRGHCNTSSFIYLLELGVVFVLQEMIAKVSIFYFFIKGGEIFQNHFQLCLNESQVKHLSLPDDPGTLPLALALKPNGGLELHTYQCHFDTELVQLVQNKHLYFTTYQY